MSNPYKTSTITKPELKAGSVWRDVTASWKAGTRHNQWDTVGDPNWCAGAALANLWEGSHPDSVAIESGKAIYGQARQEFADKYDSKMSTLYGNASLQDCAYILLRRHGLLATADIVELNTFDEIMAWLVACGPVAFGTNWVSGMYAPRSHQCKAWMEFKGSGELKHAACLIGTSARGFVRIENSVGMTWGTKGLAWMRHGDFRKAMAQKGSIGVGIRLNKISA